MTFRATPSVESDMSDIQALLSELAGSRLPEISRALGADEGQARSALSSLGILDRERLPDEAVDVGRTARGSSAMRWVIGGTPSSGRWGRAAVSRRRRSRSS